MDLDDRMTIATPEGVQLALTLAGLGSRFIAGAADLIIQLILIAIVAVVAAVASGGLLVAVAVVGVFAIWFLYPILFEVLAAGRTPGKRITSLRVVRESGAPIDLPASAIRNLMRLLDGPILLYLPTVISIAVTARNQRPGDLAAGTIVIRENPLSALDPGARLGPAEEPVEGSPEGWDVSAVSAQEIAAVRRFLERRESLERGARATLAERLAAGLRPKVAGAPPGQSAEQFLQQLARSKR